MSENLEDTLRRVAAGELTPEQALKQLGSPVPTRAAGSSASEPGAPETSYDDQVVTSIRVNTSYRSIQLIADPSVAQVHVIGRHSIQYDGSALVVTTSGPLDDDENESGEGNRGASGRFSFSALPRTIAWARSWRDHQLTMRVNPALLVDLDVTGADVKATGFEAGLRARLVASSMRGDKLHGPLDIRALSSSVKLAALPTGESRIYCESSSCRLSLDPGSDLKITATNRMSRVSLPERPVSTLPFEGESTETTIGEGRDQLTVEAVMSSVSVLANSWGSVPA
jgi:hypothetical protein